MENLTHSLVGAAIAQAALDDAMPSPVRRAAVAAGVVAANAPDVDLLYTWITPAPLGYLLHHRGHTHTLVGVLALSVAIALVWAAWPSVRRWREPTRARIAAVIALGVLSHLLLDAGNSYGVHPFYPFDNRWYYGDSVFIFEPALWTILGGALAMNSRSHLGRAAIGGSTAGLSIAAAAVGVVPWIALLAIAVAAGLAAPLANRLTARARATAAVVASAVFCVAMFGLSRAARAEAIAGFGAPPGSALLDVAMTPSPAFPICWAAIAIERDDAAGQLRLRRGSVSLAPGWWPAADCPLQRFAGARGESDGDDGSLALAEDLRVPLAELQARASADCRFHAWLRFVRAPVIDGRRAYDLRFERAGSGNFTGLPLDATAAGAGCPPWAPAWGLPRADAIAR